MSVSVGVEVRVSVGWDGRNNEEGAAGRGDSMQWVLIAGMDAGGRVSSARRGHYWRLQDNCSRSVCRCRAVPWSGRMPSLPCIHVVSGGRQHAARRMHVYYGGMERRRGSSGWSLSAGCRYGASGAGSSPLSRWAVAATGRRPQTKATGLEGGAGARAGERSEGAGWCALRWSAAYQLFISGSRQASGSSSGADAPWPVAVAVAVQGRGQSVASSLLSLSVPSRSKHGSCRAWELRNQPKRAAVGAPGSPARLRNPGPAGTLRQPEAEHGPAGVPFRRPALPSTTNPF